MIRPSEPDGLRRAGYFGILLATAFIWSTSGTAAALLPADVPGFTIGASTLGVGGLIMFFAFARATIPALLDPSIRWYLIGGGVAVFFYGLAYYSSIRMAGVAVGSLVNLGSAPIFAILMERVLDGRRIPLRRWIGIWITVVGLTLTGFNVRKPGEGGIVAQVEGLTGSGPNIELVLGAGLALLAGLFYACFTATAQRAMRRRPSASGVMGATFGVGGILLVPVILATGAPLLQSPSSIALSTYLAVGPVFLATWLFGLALQRIAASTAMIVTLIEPVLASLLAVVIVQEHIYAWGWIGIAAVMTGIMLATRE